MTTKIEWTDETWNPVTGCTKVSQGCKNCYAETVAGRFWKDRPFTDVRCHPERLEAPLHWKKPRRVFVNSMSDLFHEDVPDGFIDQVFAIMALSQGDWGWHRFGRDYSAEGDPLNGRHTFQILTKRPERMRRFMSDTQSLSRIIECSHNFVSLEDYDYDWNWPLPNVWLGVSVEDQPTADERIPLLLQTPAAVRFLSCEPLLGPIDLSAELAVRRWRTTVNGHCWWYDEETGVDGGTPTRLHWVIAGGESGPKARPSHPDWFRSLRDQCAAAGVPFFFKQWGEWGPCETEVHADERGNEVYPLEESVMESVYDLGDRRSFKVIEEHGIQFGRFGKKLNGRTLDGREHMEYPA